MELLLTRQVDVELFSGARLDFLVFDEAHAFAGTSGAETACLIRRLRRFCGKDADQTTCVATSATIVDEKDPDAARNFAARALLRPRELYLLLNELEKTVGRPVAEEELLTYLTLGAASLRNGRPLLRPVVLGFIRGISGDVVTFPTGNEPKLWLSSEDELNPDADRVWRPRVFTCTSCGQHYYASSLKDFRFTKSKPKGGSPTAEARTGRRWTKPTAAIGSCWSTRSSARRM